MMKKLLSLILVFVMIFSIDTVGYASDNKEEITIVVNNEDEILDFYNSEEYDPNHSYAFLIENTKSTRAICYMCGRPNMGTAKKAYPAKGQTIGCPENQFAPDVFETHEVWEIERCTACAFENQIKLVSYRYYAYCYFGGTWEAKASYTLEGGYNPHQCLSYWQSFN